MPQPSREGLREGALRVSKPSYPGTTAIYMYRVAGEPRISTPTSSWFQC